MKTPTTFSASVFGLLLLILLARTAGAIVIASDNASDPAYADGWTIGDDGGTGFGPWEGAGSYGVVPTMEIDEAPFESDNDLGTPALRIGTGGISGGFYLERVFENPMQAGQSFKIDFDAYSISPLEEPGRDILIGFNSDSGARLGLYAYNYDDGSTAFGSDFWGINAATANDNLAGGATLPPDPLDGIEWQTPYTTTDSSDGFSLTLDIVTIDTYRLRIVEDNVTKLDVSGELVNEPAVSGQGINKLVIYGSETGVGSTEPGGVAYFNNLRIESADDGLPGDFNADAVVDAADYTVWRDNLGAAEESTLNGNGDGMGGVDTADYQLWKDNFGDSAAAANVAVNSHGVPEPASAMLVAAGTIPFVWLRKSRT